MTIKLYKNSSDKRYLNKSLSDEKTLSNCRIYDNNSISTPTIRIDTDSVIPTGYNYAYIPDFGRYYYITDIEVSNGYILVSLSVDVLMTYKDSILSSEVIVGRQQSMFNTYLADDKFKAYEYNNQFAHAFSSPFTKNLEFVLTVQG